MMPEDPSNCLNEAILKLIKAGMETELEMSKLKSLQEVLLEAVEKLIFKIDKVIRFEERLMRIERT